MKLFVTLTHPSVTAAVPFTRSYIKAPGPPHPLCPAARANHSTSPGWHQQHRQHSSKHASKPSGGGPEHTHCQVGRGHYGCPAGDISTMERCARLLQTLLVSSCANLSSFYLCSLHLKPKQVPEALPPPAPGQTGASHSALSPPQVPHWG